MTYAFLRCPERLIERRGAWLIPELVVRESWKVSVSDDELTRCNECFPLISLKQASLPSGDNYELRFKNANLSVSLRVGKVLSSNG